MRGRPAGIAPKVEAVAERLAERVRSGAYLAAELPSEQAIADEMGVGYLTARRAVARLVASGLLARRRGGRLELASDPAARPLLVGLAVPSWSSFDVMRWQQALAAAASASPRPVAVRPIVHAGWDDPALTALAGRADGVLVYPAATGPPPARLCSATRLVVIDRDAGREDVPSLHPAPPRAVADLAEALHGWGRRRIAWIGPAGSDPATVEVGAAREGAWRDWCARRGLTATRLAPDPAALRAALPGCDAVVAVRVDEALAALRAARDLGLRVPDDLAVAVVNDEGLGPMLVPSLTAPEPPDLAAWLGRALAWIGDRAAVWDPAATTLPVPVRIARRDTA